MRLALLLTALLIGASPAAADLLERLERGPLDRRSRPLVSTERLIALASRADLPVEPRRRALEALGELGDGSALSERLELLAEIDGELAAAALAASGRLKLREVVREQLLSTGTAGRRWSASELAEAETLLSDPLDSRTPLTLRHRALELLAAQARPPLPLLRELAIDLSEPTSLRVAAATLCAADAPASWWAEVLSGADDAVVAALRAPAAELSEAAFKPLLEPLKRSQTPVPARRFIVELLHARGWSLASRVFDQLSRDPLTPPEVAAAAIIALLDFRMVPAADARERLLRLACADPDALALAAPTLGELGDERLRPLLADAFERQAPLEPLLELIEALEVSGLERSLELVAGDPRRPLTHRLAALRGLSGSSAGARTLERIARSDAEVMVRRAAVEALGQLPSSSPISAELLAEVLAVTDPSLAAACARVLARRAVPGAEPWLKARLKSASPSLKLDLVAALAELRAEMDDATLAALDLTDDDTAEAILDWCEAAPQRNAFVAVLNLLEHRAVTLRARAWQLLSSWLERPRDSRIPAPPSVDPSASPIERASQVSALRSWWRAHSEVVDLSFESRSER